MQVNIFNPSKCKGVHKKRITTVVDKVLSAERRSLSILNIIVTDDAYLRTLNRKYLKRNRATNVISFDLGTVSEIYVSCDKVGREDDLLYFIIHGLLHIIGYDDRTRKEQSDMRDKCLTYLDNA